MTNDKRTQKTILRKLLKDLRDKANIRQVDLAHRLKRPQSFVSKYESGEKNLSLIEIREICESLGITLSDFVRRFEKEMNES